MSRVGQSVINIPDGVEVKKVDNNFSAIETRYGSGYRWNVS